MKIENGYLYIEDKICKKKKITGTAFPALIGKHRFNKKGDKVLSLLGVLPYEAIDPKWLIRGDYTELLCFNSLKAKGLNPLMYDKAEINYTNFPEEKELGGLIDIELLDQHTLHEVKSKSMNNYERYLKYPDYGETYQGLFYGYLRGYDKITMNYVFYDKEVEERIFSGEKVPYSELKGQVKNYQFELEVNRQEMNDYIKQALDYENKCYDEKRVPLQDISESVLKKLGVKQDNIFEVNDMPF